MRKSTSLFTERGNGRYNDRTFPRDRAWRGEGVDALETADPAVFEVRVRDGTGALPRGKRVRLVSADGARGLEFTVEAFRLACDVGGEDRGASANCGVAVVRDAVEAPLARARKPRERPVSPRRKW